MPAGKHCGLLDALLTLDPKFFHWICSVFKNPEIAFIPNVLDEKYRYEMPNSIEKGILKKMGLPILNGF